MAVELHPSELGFKRPFNHEVTEVLGLSNPSSSSIAFKVKTTAPKQYCVRPNSGLIPPGGKVEVQVLLQAMKEDPPLDAKCRDKFLVQSVPFDGDASSTNVATIWQNVEKTGKSAVQEKKIRVNFLAADGVTKANGVVNNTTGDESPPAYSSPTPQFGSPAQGNALSTEAKPTGAKSLGDAKSSTGNPATSSLASTATAVKDSIPTSSEELKQQLAEARAQINKLTGQLSDPGLRQRKVQEANQKVQQVVQQSGESGVPLQIVAGLCLLSFLLAYFLF